MTLKVTTVASFLSLFFYPDFAQSKNALSASHELLEILRLGHIEEKEDLARSRLLYLYNSLDPDSPIYPSVSEVLRQYSPDQDILHRVRSFLSGKKKDYYCRGTGLVYSNISHNDGSHSEVALESGERSTQEGTYNKMEKGRWVYAMTSDYIKDVMRTELWIVDSGTNDFYIRESQHTERDGSGIYRMSFDKQCQIIERSFHSVGISYFPAKIHMPFELAHIWGQFDAGYCLKFERGFQSSLTASHQDLTGLHDIELSTTRKVVRHHPIFSFEFAGKKHSHRDCWEVNLQINANPEFRAP